MDVINFSEGYFGMKIYCYLYSQVKTVVVVTTCCFYILFDFFFQFYNSLHASRSVIENILISFMFFAYQKARKIIPHHILTDII